MPRVTIVLPVYNHERYLEHALDSLIAQDYRDYQIVAVNDGSTDSSLDILHRHRGQVLVIDAPHEGPAAARNRALRASPREADALAGDHPLQPRHPDGSGAYPLPRLRRLLALAGRRARAQHPRPPSGRTSGSPLDGRLCLSQVWTCSRDLGEGP